MTIESAERYLPTGGGIENAFDTVDTWHQDSIGDISSLNDMIERGDSYLFADYLNAGFGWLANRTQNPFIQRVSEDVWRLLEQGGQDAPTAFVQGDPAEALAQIVHSPVVYRPDPHFIEGIVTTMTEIDGKSVIFFIVPAHFFTHAHKYPVEAIAHLASASQLVRDMHHIRLKHSTNLTWIEQMMSFTTDRSFATIAEILLEAGDSYSPSSPDYERTRQKALDLFPHGVDSLPQEAKY